MADVDDESDDEMAISILTSFSAATTTPSTGAERSRAEDVFLDASGGRARFIPPSLPVPVPMVNVRLPRASGPPLLAGTDEDDAPRIALVAPPPRQHMTRVERSAAARNAREAEAAARQAAERTKFEDMAQRSTTFANIGVARSAVLALYNRLIKMDWAAPYLAVLNRASPSSSTDAITMLIDKKASLDGLYNQWRPFMVMAMESAALEWKTMAADEIMYQFDRAGGNKERLAAIKRMLAVVFLTHWAEQQAPAPQQRAASGPETEPVPPRGSPL